MLTAAFFGTGGWSYILAITRYVVYLTAIITSTTVVWAPVTSKCFYSFCALLYFIIGALGLVATMAWYV